MKNELQTMRLFSPLFPHLYRKNEWGDYENEPEDLTSEELLDYEDELHTLIQKAQLPYEDKHGLAIYLDETLSRKVSSIYPDVEEYSGKLYVSFWDASDRFFIKPENEMPPEHSFGMTMGGR